MLSRLLSLSVDSCASGRRTRRADEEHCSLLVWIGLEASQLLWFSLAHPLSRLLSLSVHSRASSRRKRRADDENCLLLVWIGLEARLLL